MFHQVFVEEAVLHSPRTKKILSHLKVEAPITIEKIEDHWGRSRKPYLDKRTNLNLYLGNKAGTKIKIAPPAYGLSKEKAEKHFYFIHAYNCIYECQYCYLQGYFNTPDIVLFLNHEEIIAEMATMMDENPHETIWFHAGEFSDSLALSHLTGELPLYHDFLKKYPRAQIELRTKSVNIKPLLELTPLPNLYVSFSLAPEKASRTFDLKTPGLQARLKAIKELSEKGFSLGLHFDPIINDDQLIANYSELIDQLFAVTNNQVVAYLSLGVVRFTKDVFHQMEKNYPESPLLAEDFIKSFDNKIRYPRPQRLWLMGKIKNLLIEKGLAADKIYLCMEQAND